MATKTDVARDPIAEALTRGGVGAEIARHDWSATTLGPIAGWPASLRALVAMMLSCPTPMFLAWGPELLCLYNDAYRPILGWRADTALGAPFRRVWESIWSDIEPMVTTTLAGGSTSVEDMEFDLSRDGRPERSWWSFTYSPAYDDTGAVAGLMCVTGETTGRVELARSREDLARSEEQFRVFAQAVPNQIWAARPDGHLDWVNDQVYAYTGLAPGGLDGKTGWQRHVHPEDRAAADAAWTRALANGGLYEIEFRLLRHDGAYRWFLGRAEAVRLGDAITRWVGTNTDINEQRSQAQELATLAATLEEQVATRTRDLMAAEEALRQSQKIEAVGQLTGGVAHDFNNLLTVIRGSVDLLRRPDISPERRDRYIDAIAETADRATRLTSQLLSFARRQALKPEVFDVGESIAAVLQIVRTLCGSRIRIAADVAACPCPINADRSQFDTAIVNMAVNARDAMGGEGDLAITVRTVDGIPAVRAHAPVPGRFIGIAIRDGGTGIDAGTIDRIFEPFFTTKGVGHGTGLGLSQVFGFAKQSGGDIIVESAPGEGATFTLYLPVSNAAAPALPADADAAGATLGEGACVLVVEDNAEVGAFATQALAELGYHAVLAPDAATALRELKTCGGARFDVVFSDVVMPGMSGIDLGREIGRLYPDLPVILASGYSNVLAEGGAHGFDLLHKPYSIDQLSRALRAVACPRRGVQAAADSA